MSQPDNGHHRLRNRYLFTGPLLLETPLRVSSGRASDDTDAPVMRRLDGLPYIPGSSLRGALRSELERVIAGAGTAAGLRTCTLFQGPATGAPSDAPCRVDVTNLDCPDNCPASCTVECSSRYRLLQYKWNRQGLSSEEREAKTREFMAQRLCSICGLFGAAMFASRLVIEDALPENLTNIPGRIRDGVGIDRDTGAARETVKFDFEVIEPGHRFTFNMMVENVCGDAERNLITLTINLLQQGLHVGGKRSAGLGRIRLESWQVAGFNRADQLWNRLLSGQSLYTSLTWPEAPPC